eukprot:TRINITY_DN784_c0_g1_i2.p1 TRINITY_DN784_c0_g1~~TRINITY_DN784_c0_g1_i2.p1  ORF type:complete len:277 (-),score=73.24 TRINITY_DN784_c0_g1_i2:304-1134(-)
MVSLKSILLVVAALIAAIAIAVPVSEQPLHPEHGLSCFGRTSVVIEKIPDAENQVFSSDGRYFVTGGKNAYEVTRDASGKYASRELFAKPIGLLLNYFLGIVELHNTLYVAYTIGTKSYLTAAPLNSTLPTLSIIHELNTLFPNGMAVNARAEVMFLADTMKSTISRIRVDRNNPLRVTEERVVISDTIKGPNGMTYYEGLLFAANSDSIYSMTVDGDGNLGTPNVIFKLSGLLVVLDDLSIVNNGNWIAIAEYLGGRVLIIDRARGLDLDLFCLQ